MDNQKQAFEEELKAENEVFKCPGCGANLTFEPEQEELTCQYCDYHVRLKGTSSQQEFDFFGAEDVKNTWNTEMKILHCQNCGANNVVEKKIISRMPVLRHCPSNGQRRTSGFVLKESCHFG